MKRIEAIVRTERAAAVVAALREEGVPRMTLSHVHALGSGVDPEHYRLSFEEGAASDVGRVVKIRTGAEDMLALM